ncbi:hypothetical protein J4407_01950 [Candidatus Pacearchaeota archaeon]|nr:hypothetical protein [Candidatus Pacearchaeota archaeon]
MTKTIAPIIKDTEEFLESLRLRVERTSFNDINERFLVVADNGYECSRSEEMLLLDAIALADSSYLKNNGSVEYLVFDLYENIVHIGRKYNRRRMN